MKNFIFTFAVLMSVSVFSEVKDFPLEDWEDFEHPYKEGEILIRYLSDLTSQEKDFIRGQVNAQIISNDFIVPNLELMSLEGQDVPTALERLKTIPGVLYATPNYLVSANMGIFPRKPKPPKRQEPDPLPDPVKEVNDPYLKQSYGIGLIGSPQSWHQFTMGAREIIVGIVDTGIDYSHEDLAQNMWKNPIEIPNNNIDDDNNGFIDDVYGWNFSANNNNPFDDNKHGTHVAGTIGAIANNNLGTAGVSPTISLMACKFLDRQGWGATDGAIRAISYAVANGAKVLNNSWGGGGFSQALYDAVKTAERSGVLFVAAAGNNGTNNDSKPTYPASYDAGNVIAVAATDSADGIAKFSNFGKNSVDLGAPGVEVFSTLPGNRYGNLNGTSMASPHVAGAAALILAYKPQLSVNELKHLILRSTNPVQSLNGKTATGGRLNVYNALRLSLLSF